MAQKDFYPYKLVSETPETMVFEFQKGRKFNAFFLSRFIPVLLLVFVILMPAGEFRRNLGKAFYLIFMLSILAVIFALSYARFTAGITFNPGSMTLNFKRSFFSYIETEILRRGDEILVIKEYGKGAAWIFYLVHPGQKKKKLFSIPASLVLNLASRDNFIAIFEQKYNLKTTVRGE